MSHHLNSWGTNTDQQGIISSNKLQNLANTQDKQGHKPKTIWDSTQVYPRLKPKTNEIQTQSHASQLAILLLHSPIYVLDTYSACDTIH